MGKGFQNFMSKKDFHPSAWWNLKKVWEAKEKVKLNEQKEEEARIQYAKEQELMNNKALLGDEKAKLGLSFMYDAPTGMMKREEPKEEPKFEWQRKYNAPREEWAKNNDLIQDQPFGIQVRNVRCVKCHTWGHLNTDRECPMFNMSGNADNPGYVNDPSQLIKEIKKAKESKPVPEEQVKEEKSSDESENDDYEGEKKAEPVPQRQLIHEIKEDHGFNFKSNILHNLRSDDVLKNLNTTDGDDEVQRLLAGVEGSSRKRVLARVFGKKSKEYKREKAAQKAAKLAKKESKKKQNSSDDSDASSGDEEVETRRARPSKRARSVSESPSPKPTKRRRDEDSGHSRHRHRSDDDRQNKRSSDHHKRSRRDDDDETPAHSSRRRHDDEKRSSHRSRAEHSGSRRR